MKRLGGTLRELTGARLSPPLLHVQNLMRQHHTSWDVDVLSAGILSLMANGRADTLVELLARCDPLPCELITLPRVRDAMRGHLVPSVPSLSVKDAAALFRR